MDESSHYDTYYDEIDSRNYDGEKYNGRKAKYSYPENPQYKGWKDVDGSEYRGDDSTEEEEEDYSGNRPLNGRKSQVQQLNKRNYLTEIHEYPSKTRGRSKPSNLIIPIYRKRVHSHRRSGDISNETILPEIER